MKLKLTKSAVSILAALLTLGGAGANAQTPTKISFGKGKNFAVIKGSTGPHGITYVVGARSGQKMIITALPASSVGLKVETTGRFGHQVLVRQEHGGTFEVGIEESGDHTIFIGPLEAGPASFTLTVKIKKRADI